MKRKRWAQYELTDKNIIRKVVGLLDLKYCDHVLEIGPGRGALTFPIRDITPHVTAVEIDKDLCAALTEKGVNVSNADFLEVDIDRFSPDVKVVSNLPYYVATPIITHIINRFNFIVFVMQEEFARRITAHPGGKDYGAISVFVQFYSDPSVEWFVSRRCFRPVPGVDSCVVRFRRRERRLGYPEDFLFKVVRAAFGCRRKMMKNTLKGFSGIGGVVSLDMSRRPETVSLDEFCALGEELWKKQKA